MILLVITSFAQEFKESDIEKAKEQRVKMTTIKKPVDWVNPLIDTAKPTVRWVFSAFACRPFGMVRLSPDTDIKGMWGTGYCYTSDIIQCFSHVHSWQLSGIPVMPTTGVFKGTAGPDAYYSRFRHKTETVRPGYYSVMLDDYGIRAELTSTERVGFHRYTFPENEVKYILFDLGTELGPSKMADAFVRKVNDTEIEGYVENDATHRRPKKCRIYFVARFNKPFATFAGWRGKTTMVHPTRVSGADSGVFVKYAASGVEEIILLKVAISFVSIEQARLNLETELPHWNFDHLRKESSEVWNRWLSRIKVEGGSRKQRMKFYTDLWRSLLGGQIMSDVNGKYCDMTGEKPVIRKVPPDEYGNPSYLFLGNADIFWGAHWSLSLLWALAYPEITSHYCNSLVEMYRNGGLIPRGPSGGNYTFVMIAAHSTSFLVSAYMKGIRDFDIETAYEGMRKNAFPGGLMSKAGYEHYSCEGGGIEYYIGRGYIPEDRNISGIGHVDGAAQTLEYAYDDWCLAQLALMLDKEEDYQLFRERSRNYRNLFDTETGFMRPKNRDGSWIEPYEPLSFRGWCEANGWQYTWYVPHDVQGLIRLMGGREEFTEKLNSAFEKAVSSDFYAEKPEKRRDAAYINYGNEPGRFVAHLFNHSGSPWLAQKWGRQVKEQTFGSVEPLGFCEDDDNGLAAATSVLLALGLFDVRGGAACKPVYEITSPIFDKVTVFFNSRYYNGDKFTIETRNNSPENKYIQSATLNGKPLHKTWFYHRELEDGGNLVLTLGPEPNKDWGSQPRDAPPSMSEPK